jgi:hypothetical protein
MALWNRPPIPEDPTGDYSFVPFVIILQGVVFDGPGVQPRDRLEDLVIDLQGVVTEDAQVDIELPAEIKIEGEDELVEGVDPDDVAWLEQLESEGLVEPGEVSLPAEHYYPGHPWEDPDDGDWEGSGGTFSG